MAPTAARAVVVSRQTGTGEGPVAPSSDRRLSDPNRAEAGVLGRQIVVVVVIDEAPVAMMTESRGVGAPRSRQTLTGGVITTAGVW